MMERRAASVVIIGGGCNGLSAAYHLAKAGVRDVAVVERGYLGCGATGRCGGGMRQQWSTPGNILLAKHSLEAFRRFHEELGQEIDYVEGGYLLPAYSDETVAEFRANIALQNTLGVPSRFITPDEVHAVAPLLDTEGMRGASYCATDAKSYPFYVIRGYSERAREMGVRIHTNTAVKGFDIAGDRIRGVVTNRGVIATDWVINTAGAHAAEIAALAGVAAPITPYRHQLLVTEPVEPCLDPMVINLRDSLYFSQTKHGAFLVGQTDKYVVPGFNYAEHWRFEVEVAKKIARCAPALGRLNVIRHWAGHYAMTPDRQPIIGRLSPFENFLIAAGYSGHGYMLSPASGRILAELVTQGKVDFVDLEPYAIERFRGGRFTVEANVV